MKNLNDREIGCVSGGLCENMNVSECISGSSESIINEVQILGSAVSSAAFSAFDSLQAMGGSFGIWLYNVTHEC